MVKICYKTESHSRTSPTPAGCISLASGRRMAAPAPRHGTQTTTLARQQCHNRRALQARRHVNSAAIGWSNKPFGHRHLATLIAHWHIAGTQREAYQPIAAAHPKLKKIAARSLPRILRQVLEPQPCKYITRHGMLCLDSHPHEYGFPHVVLGIFLTLVCQWLANFADTKQRKGTRL